MRKLILSLVLTVILLANISLAANLGFYKAGDTVTYSVVCLTDEGAKDTGCSAPDDDILDPDDTVAKSPTSALAEVNETAFPGLWRGSYTIPSSPTAGTWSIFIELTNSNSTTAATVLNFQVLSDSNYPASHGDLSSGIVTLTSTTETQIDNIEADTNELQTNQNWNVWDDASRTLTACPCSGWATSTDVDNECISETELNASHGSCNYCTATGFSTHSASDVWAVATRTLTSPIAGGYNMTGIKADVSSLATSSEISDLQFHGDSYWNTSTLSASDIDTQLTSSHGSGAWTTATGFSTHSAADVWTVATRNLTDYGNLVLDIWNESQSSYSTPGTFGYYLDAQISNISVSGASAQEIWEYNITGLNQTTDSAGWYITTIKTIVEWIERLL